MKPNNNDVSNPLIFFIGVFVAGLAFALVAAIPTAFIVMLGLGIAHGVCASVPALGFLATWVSLVALGFVGGTALGKNVRFNVGEKEQR